MSPCRSNAGHLRRRHLNNGHKWSLPARRVPRAAMPATSRGTPRNFQTNRAPRFASSSSKLLLIKNALHLGQSLLACDFVTGGIGCTRTRHGLIDSVKRLRRYFAHSFLNGSHRTRRRLSNPNHGAWGSTRPGGRFCVEIVVDLYPHAGDVIRTWAGVTRRHRCSERSRARHCQSQISHDCAFTSASYTYLDHPITAFAGRILPPGGRFSFCFKSESGSCGPPSPQRTKVGVRSGSDSVIRRSLLNVRFRSLFGPSRTSPEVREVPSKTDSCSAAITRPLLMSRPAARSRLVIVDALSSDGPLQIFAHQLDVMSQHVQHACICGRDPEIVCLPL